MTTGSAVTYIAAVAGQAALMERPIGDLRAGHVRVRTVCSAISPGTEILILDRSESTGDQQPHALGYQASGVVEDVSSELANLFPAGSAVACYGGPYVGHASIVDVPRHLVARMPAGVDHKEASFCGLGTIALQAFRTAQLQLGETVAVLGLGVLGNLCAQVSLAAGCRVATIDFIPFRREVASNCGLVASESMVDLARNVYAITDGNGADSVMIAIGQCDDETLEAAFKLVRHGGRVVMVGTTNAQVPREAMFAKEASLHVSRAGGPGRYDIEYERDGKDYPYAYARWTEHRNLQEVMRLFSLGKLIIAPIITDIVEPGSCDKVYQSLRTEPGKHMGIVYDWS